MLLGGYTLLRRLGEGGMAEVFLARQKSKQGIERLCVIKRILRTISQDPSFVKSFVVEAKLLAQLNHPNIVQLLELGEDNGEHFMALEYVDGCDLLRLRELHGRALPVDIALSIFLDVCDGLAYAHDACDIDGRPLLLVHRDVSPSNVLVSVNGTAKIADFGIAKTEMPDTQHTQTGLVKGKATYFAPEQIRNQPLDRRVDVFASGILLYELLSGVHPFRRDNTFDTMRAISDEVPAPFSRDCDPLALALEPVVLRALAKSRDQRTPSMAALASEIEAVAGVRRSRRDVAALVARLVPPHAPESAPAAADGATRSLPAGDSGSLARLNAEPHALAGPKTSTQAMPASRPRLLARPTVTLLLAVSALVLAVGAAALGRHSPAGDDAAASAAPQATDPIGAAPTAERAPELARAPDSPLAPNTQPTPSAPMPSSRTSPAVPAATPSAKRSLSKRMAGSEADAAAQGTLVFEVAPLGSQVFIDGKRIGELPIPPHRLGVGAHDVRIERSGFSAAKRRVRIEENQTAVIELDLAPL